MTTAKVWAPASLLLDPDLTASLKLLWLIRRLYPEAGPTELAAHSGLAQNTVRTHLSRLTSQSWATERKALLPNALLTDRRLSAKSRILFGTLQLLPNYDSQAGQCTYLSLSNLTGQDLKTVRSAVQELTAAGWLQVTQTNQRAPLTFRLTHPNQPWLEAERARMEQRLKRATWTGEAIMREFLSLMVESDLYEENACPGFLINPFTHQPLEFDRFYPPDVAVEFNGDQHYGPTELFPSAEDAARQRGRDLIKLATCLERGIKLIIIRPADLCLQGMQAKIGPLLPLRDLRDRQELVGYLERLGRRYLRKSAGLGRP